ncbi:hypothetical protein DSY4540 [Desulfitobacterium hafniense Y51]|uniref:Uncharacterized protein n=1 Tax=Desulfitobacterium hafniense (strain Y51) TaxID=138119 RepID=Q24NR3_DESHY|nr:hypothetical protein DSY4540 [Desulfitobacterium hafniense Y51]
MALSAGVTMPPRRPKPTQGQTGGHSGLSLVQRKPARKGLLTWMSPVHLLLHLVLIHRHLSSGTDIFTRRANYRDKKGWQGSYRAYCPSLILFHESHHPSWLSMPSRTSSGTCFSYRV